MTASGSTARASPDWAASDWTLIDSHREPIARTETGFAASSTYLIEPFLAGEYTIPSFGVEITPTPDAQPYPLVSLPLTIQVQSVLASEDSGELDPAAGFVDPETELANEPQPKAMLYALIAGVIFFSALVIWRLTRPSLQSQTPRSAYALLELVATGHEGSESDAYNTLYQAFTRLDPRLQHTSEIRSLIEQCECARFSANESSALDPQTIARHTLELLGGVDGEAA